MPSPFPGMDPYLEGPHWHGFHTVFCVEIARQLSPMLGEGYVALVEQRVVMDVADEVVISTQELRGDASILRESRAASSYGSAVLDPPMRMSATIEEPTREAYVEVRTVGDKELVTVIEVLSPSNKRGKSRELYLRKRGRLLRSSVHLIEIDLLRGGDRLPMHDPYPSEPYYVLVHRADRRPVADVWPVALESPLPTAPVPLLAPDPDVPLDLQATFSSAYDAFRYDRVLDYTQPPRVELTPEEQIWAGELLRPSREAARI